jgi:hypothetical protein
MLPVLKFSFCIFYFRFCTPGSNSWQYNIFGYWKGILRWFRWYNDCLFSCIIWIEQLGNGWEISAYCTFKSISQVQFNKAFIIHKCFSRNNDTMILTHRQRSSRHKVATLLHSFKWNWDATDVSRGSIVYIHSSTELLFHFPMIQPAEQPLLFTACTRATPTSLAAETKK